VDRHLWLIGMMGSGKSVVGPLVAYRLGIGFVDTDAVVANQAGVAIDELWERSGEATFRRLETAAVADAAVGPAAVVAAGGGAVVEPANVRAMAASGAVVWLRATPETLSRRVGDGSGRPLLAGDVPVDRLRSILAARSAAYGAAADLTIDTDDLAAEDIAQEIEAWWNEF
jgi:shikimate kinase